MAASYTDYTSSTSKIKDFTFPYIKQSDIKVRKTTSAGVVTELVEGTATGASPGQYTWTNATRLTLNDAPVSADTIRVYRDTASDALVGTFYPGSAIRSSDLNDNFTQNLYVTQEAEDSVDTANTNASTAKTDAADAKTTADAASTNATTALNNSRESDGSGGYNTAISIANTASTNATNAVNTANAASTTAGAAFQRDGSATMTGNIVFEGATDDAYETTLTVADPSGSDKTITLPNVSGTVPVLAVASTTQITSTPEELNILDGVTSTAAELNILDGVTSTAAELNILDGVTSTAAELNILDGVTSTAAEINILDGVTSTAAELNYVDGVTSNVQTQIDGKQPTAANLTTLAGMQSGTASVLADSTALTSTTAELNLLDGKSVVTAVSGSSTDVQLPTAKAVNDQIVAVINDVGGFTPIADDQSFPNTNPDPGDDAGTIVSIADAGGLVVNGSGVSTTGRTLGGSTVTINGIDSTLYSTTIAAGKGMLVQTTTTLNTYDYHRLVVDEAGVDNAQTLVTDFNQRYRVNAGEPSSHLTDGDLVFDTSANKMKVYDSSASTWKEVTSAGDFKYLFLCPAGGTGAPTLDGSIATYDLREGSNSGSAASITNAAQLMVSINGVVQKANTGTSAPAEGFALVDSNTIIFGANLASGDSVFIIQFGSALTINEPGDNTVATAKIQNGAVTTAKIADDAVTNDKIADADLVSLAGCQTGAAAALAALTSTEVEILDGATVTAAELNILDGVTSTAAELNILDGVTSTAAELNILDGVTSTATELNILDGVTSTTAELNTLDGFTGDKDDLIYAKDLKATGVTDTEFDYLDGVTSAIQTQLDAKAPSANPSFTGLLTEEVKVTAGKLSDNTNIDLEDGMVHLFTTAESTTSTPNLRWNSSTALNTKVDTGESISVTIITTANASGFSAQLTIDGSAVTENWVGGSAPDAGGSSGVDIHAYTIIKTASATWTVIANHSTTS